MSIATGPDRFCSGVNFGHSDSNVLSIVKQTSIRLQTLFKDDQDQDQNLKFQLKIMINKIKNKEKKKFNENDIISFIKNQFNVKVTMFNQVGPNIATFLSDKIINSSKNFNNSYLMKISPLIKCKQMVINKFNMDTPDDKVKEIFKDFGTILGVIRNKNKKLLSLFLSDVPTGLTDIKQIEGLQSDLFTMYHQIQWYEHFDNGNSVKWLNNKKKMKFSENFQELNKNKKRRRSPSKVSGNWVEPKEQLKSNNNFTGNFKDDPAFNNTNPFGIENLIEPDLADYNWGDTTANISSDTKSNNSPKFTEKKKEESEIKQDSVNQLLTPATAKRDSIADDISSKQNEIHKEDGETVTPDVEDKMVDDTDDSKDNNNNNNDSNDEHSSDTNGDVREGLSDGKTSGSQLQ